MNKYYGKLGFAINKETAPGVWTSDIEEIQVYGDVLKNSRRNVSSGVNDNVVINNQISILLNTFIMSNLSNLLYVEFMGTLWKVDSVDIEYPRIILTTGGVYNGE